MPTKGDEILSDDFRCQPGAATGENTDVYTVKPGDKIKLKGAFGMTSIEHPGPAQVYMSKAPTGDVKTYDGSGDWFVVERQLLCGSPTNEGILTEAWCLWGQDGIEFTMPSRLPAGEYLIRAEHVPLHGAHDGGAEFYYACAQVKLEASSEKMWAPKRLVKIPGVYAVEDPDINFSIWDPSITEYPYTPGPAVIIGGEVKGSANGMTDSIAKVGRRSLEFSGSLAAKAAVAVTF